MKNKLEKNREKIGAENREKMWGEFPDTFGGKRFFEIFNFWKVDFSDPRGIDQISDREIESDEDILEK